MVVLADGFAHRTRYPVDGRILQWLAVAVVAAVEAVLVAGGQALINSLQHVEEEEVEVVDCLLHIHKASQPDQQIGQIDSLVELQGIKVVAEVVVVVEQQRDLASGWLEKWVAHY